MNEEKENPTWSLHSSISAVCKLTATTNSSASGFCVKLQKYLSKQIWTQGDRQAIVTVLTEFFLSGLCTVELSVCLGPLVIDVVSRIEQTILNEQRGAFALKKFAVILSEGFPVNQQLRQFALNFVKTHQPFTPANRDSSCEPARKKAKKAQISDVVWCRAMWSYMTFVPELSPHLDMICLLEYLGHKDGLTRWFAASATSKYLNMTEKQTGQFFRKYFMQDEQRTLTLRVDAQLCHVMEQANKYGCLVKMETSKDQLSHTKQNLTETDLSDSVVSVEGILTSANSAESEKMAPMEEENVMHSSLVMVPSTRRNMRSLALAVSGTQPVLLQGPVGCGKTCLVEHLAAVTGHKLVKIQLGDQTDSKALLGTYCSTEVPGEFVWRAGVLTRAVREGQWVLLEDVDTAPMDVLSVLVGLVETGALTGAGGGSEAHIKAAPGFQLFTTQRFLSTSEGVHKERAGNSSLLERHCTVVYIEPLSKDELVQVISCKFPALTPVADKLLEIYFMLSAGRHDTGSDSSADVSSHGKFLSAGGRLISTRDLMTWCSRSSVNFDHKESSQGLKVFLEAVDCFVSCLPKQTSRLKLAAAIGFKLNLAEERSKYFCLEYKPSLSESTGCLEIGRAKLERRKRKLHDLTKQNAPTFSYTRSSLVLLEKVAICVQRNEAVLLSGETGTGKTFTVQYLAHHLGHKLHVVNLNQQSDSSDLLGGFKPVDLKFLVIPLREEFEILFCQTFSRAQNEKFLSHVQTLFSRKRWKDLLSLIEAPIKNAMKKLDADSPEAKNWMRLAKRIADLRFQIREAENVLAFSFIEGTLVRALRSGDWVLLDEINLATAETLECLSGLLESISGSVVLTERGDSDPVKRDPQFRLFACMNPATDVGKKDLPVGIRNRFTEFYVDELECPKDLATLVRDYLPGLSLSSRQITGIVNFYLDIKGSQVDKLTDGTGHKPHYSLRTLCRALRYCARNPCKSVPRSLYEGFCLSFLTALDRSSHPTVEGLVLKHILASSATKAVLGQKLPHPAPDVVDSYVDVTGYWVATGALKPAVPDNYIVTPSVKKNLKDLARVVAAGKHPVLLQGETSVGKTSLIVYLAQLTGNKCVRVNNHEHTDLQEYIGCYAADESGKLVFKEGVLVEAMRKGHWVILDELNLAPTDVLEALNRLLDDNQELYIPETQEMVQAHPKFMLFATQNPPGLYGGRKILSRAFRNRFIELHFDEIPAAELETILHERCSIPLSYARKLVAVMLELQTRRRGSGIFFGKQGFMTLRDLFRWAQRYNCPEAGQGEKFYDWDQHLAEHGYMLLAGRVRKPEEEATILSVIQKHLKRTLHPEDLFTIGVYTPQPLAAMLTQVISSSLGDFKHIVWTYSMRRLAVLIGQAIRFKEPVLLVGDTGIGKTTVCQLYAMLREQQLYSVNCHMHTESADFLGGLRPVRAHDNQEGTEDQKLFEWKDGPLVLAMREGAMFLIDEISLADDSVLERLNSVLESERTLLLAERVGGSGDDSSNEVEKLEAASGFQVFATMNPGGDFGKKELSPALRNRFTEIWCPQSQDRADLESIIERNVAPHLHLLNTEDGTSGFGRAMLDFIEWFTTTDIGRRTTVSIRDILSWVRFINICCSEQQSPDTDDVEMNGVDVTSGHTLEPVPAYLHGACLVFIDSLGAGSSTFSSEAAAHSLRRQCLDFLCKQLSTLTGCDVDLTKWGLHVDRSNLGDRPPVAMDDKRLTIHPFSIDREPVPDFSGEQFTLQAPTTCENAQRLLRGLQLPRPILLEGSPGVGKTSLVAAVARLARKTLVRINLSEQTDVTDLFGADLPVEGEQGGRFAWRDGPFLQALKAGHWIVFDELNLASQSVLEGLNACFDHRAEVYIPELGKSFAINHTKIRIFACQNPLSQGGGRKGLPKSFLNRFTQVYVEALSREDLIFITCSMYPKFSDDMLTAMVDFNSKMYEETMIKKLWGSKGSPWEFNLRDLFRWCDLLRTNQTMETLNPGEYVGLIYKDRMRSAADKAKVEELYSSTLGHQWPLYQPSRKIFIGESSLQAGHSFLAHSQDGPSLSQQSRAKTELLLLHHCLEPLESLVKCVQMNWLAILVGPQSSGKSSLVQLLAQLSGQHLSVLPMNSAMDTTELLGGFEQSDTLRHVKSVASLVEKGVRIAQRHALVENGGSPAQFADLEKEWTSYLGLESSVEGVGHEEVQALLLSHIHQLKSCLMYLDKLDHKTIANTLELREELLCLENAVRCMSPGSGGGAFEWVDSVFVTALKEGHWLLVDNVNFCSASVLDRLNALLEPGGVLTINERGTVDGEIPSVVPHPNFRLFFAMDPRLGEISRAMRNRGIEIYMLGEDEGKPYSKADVVSMLTHGSSFIDTPLSDWLICLHEKLKTDMTFGERPVLADLLQAGYMTSELMTRGLARRAAVSHAVEDVFLRRCRNIHTKKLARDIIYEHLEMLPDPADASITTDLMSLALHRQEDNSTLRAVKDAGRLVVTLLQETDAQSSDHPAMCPQTVALIFASLQSEHTWHLATGWLDLVQQKLTTSAGSDSSARILPGFQQLQSTTLACLRQVFEGKLWPRLKTLLSGVLSQGMSVLSEQPWDLSHNPQATRHAATLIQEASSNTRPALQEVETILQRLQLMQVAYAASVSLKDKVVRLETMQAKGTKRRSSSSPHHPAQGVISLLLSQMYDSLPQLVEGLDEVTGGHLAQTPHNLLWLHRLADVILTSPASVHQQVLHAHLTLHWQWVEDKLGQVLTLGHRENPKLLLAIEELRRHLGCDAESGSAAKLFLSAWTNHGHPQPYLTQVEAELVCELRKVISSLRPGLSDSPQVVSNKIRALTICQDSHTYQVQVAHIAGLLRDDDMEAAHRALECLKLKLRKACVLQQTTDSDNKTQPFSGEGSALMQLRQGKDNSSTYPAQIVPLWPVYEQMSILAHLAYTIVTGNMRGVERAVVKTAEAGDSKDLICLQEFMLAHSPDLAHCVVLAGKDVWDYEQHLYNKLWNSPACKDQQRWLEWTNLVEEESFNKEDLGPAMLHQASLSRLYASLLSGQGLTTLPSSTKSTEVVAATLDMSSLLPLQLTLSGVEEQICQVSLLSRHAWSHAAVFAASDMEIRTLEKVWLAKSAERLVRIIQTLLCASNADIGTTLTANGSGNIRDMIKDIQNSLATTNMRLPKTLHTLICRCLDVLVEALTCDDGSNNSVLIGRGFVYLGLVLSNLLAPRGPVDPVEKASLKLGHVNTESCEIDAELLTWNRYVEMSTGRSIADTRAEHLHPRILLLLARREKLAGQREKLLLRQAYRQDQLQYSQLSQVISGFLDTTSSSRRVLDMVSKLSSSLTSTAKKVKQEDIVTTGTLQEERVWQDTTSRFLDRLQESYPTFRDLTTPFVIAVHQMKFGLRLMASGFSKWMKNQKFGEVTQPVSSLVKKLCTFPSVWQDVPDLQHMAQYLASRDTLDLVAATVATSDVKSSQAVGSAVPLLKSRLLSCALLYLAAHCSTSGTSGDMSDLAALLVQFTSAWREQEDRRRAREAEQAALFKFKDETHGDERSEKEKDEADFKAAYPSFDKDFIDVTGAENLEDVGLEATPDDQGGDNSRSGLDGLSAGEMSLVCGVHQSVYTALAEADWLDNTSQQQKTAPPCGDNSTSTSPGGDGGDRQLLLAPALMAYQIGAHVVKSHSDVLEPELDGKILGSHVLVSMSVVRHIQTQQEIGPASQNDSAVPSSSSYNIYYDENVAEVLQCRNVLANLAHRVAELQAEWPDHPTLVLLNKIMERILSFSVLSPVVKYLTGLELLLQKAQDWESNAASFVSLSTQLAEITAVIVAWRKLELSCWRNSLDREEQKCRDKASHWWFHLHQLITGFLGDDAQDKMDEAVPEILVALKKFMEGSNLGEFSVRLRMLYAFHCQLLHIENCPAQEKLMCILWNVHQFYQQYRPAVEAEIKRLRSPIETQLKGFVKIARWSDMNYWALKDSTEKTHRAVHKRVKEYQAVLTQPAKGMLGDYGDDLLVQAIKQTSGFPLEQNLAGFARAVVKGLAETDTQSTEITSETSDVLSRDFTLLARVSKLYKKMKVHLKRCIRKSSQSRKIVAFDNFSGELIEEMHSLQALQVDTTAEKEKQKVEARSIDLRKRKGLAELFKYLTQIGLSYRKGITGSNLLSLTDALEMTPLSLAPHQSLPPAKLWTGSENYFYRCISRYAQFAAAVANPSKELGMADVQRCRGFTTHLGHLYLEQRTRLTELVSQYLKLRRLVNAFEIISELRTPTLPPQSSFRNLMTKTKALTTKLRQGLAQFLLLLDSCPQHQAAKIHPSPFTAEHLSPAALWTHGDENWARCHSNIQTLLQTVKLEQSKIDAVLKKPMFGWSDTEAAGVTIETLKSFVPTLSAVISDFSAPSSDQVTPDISSNDSPLVATLGYLASEVSSHSQHFDAWRGQYKQSSKEECVSSEHGQVGEKEREFVAGVESLVEQLLLSVQHVVQTEAETGGSTEVKGQPDGDADEVENEEEELCDAHLSQHLLEMEKKVTKGLNCSQIIEDISSLVYRLHGMSEDEADASTNIGVCISSLVQCRPLVAAFSTLVEGQVGYSVALHRSMGKMLSVLLATFTELALKGFCIPPELSDEMEGEGATEFKDIEGGGIGEGEGAKDVSDQIETEDQLEEAKRPDQQQDEDESKDQPDIPAEDNAIEMSEDFEGKMHDQDKQENDEKDEDEDEDDNKEEEDMEKEMGETGGESDKLDERMWGSDEEEEEEEDKDQEEETEGGGGMDKQMEESVAKDDNKDAADDKDDDSDEKKNSEEDNQPNEMVDDEEYDDNKVDPHNKEDKEEDADNLDIPEDMNLDDGEKKGQEEEDMETEEKPDDVEENKEDKDGEDQTEEGEEEGGDKEEEANEDVGEEEKEEGDAPASKAEENKEEEEEEGEGKDGTSGQEEEEKKEEEKPLGELSDDTPQPQADKVDAADAASGEATQQAELADADRDEQAEGGLEQEEAHRDHNDQEQKGVGAASAEDQDGNLGQKSNQTTESSMNQQEQKKQRKPGETDDNRSLGSRDKDHRRLKTVPQTREGDGAQDENDDSELKQEDKQVESSEYQHVKEPKSHWDAQTVDAATQEQTQETQAVPDQEEGGEVDDEEDIKMEEERGEENMESSEARDKRPQKSKSKDKTEGKEEEESTDGTEERKHREKMEVDGEKVLTHSVENRPESSIHTVLENLLLDPSLLDGSVDEMRSELEQQVSVWSHSGEDTADMMRAASEAWQKYQAITCSLSQELCEQLRLILEPSQATKLKGDYRTGKRLNMRKVIPYIASQFRKDKIWLRRSKPSKRQYQIMIAMDDSASMADSHSKQLAFESLALVSNALTLLESGELAVCSFGEDVRVLHPFFEPFTHQSGANILQQLKCEQKQTKYGLLLDTALGLMQQASVRAGPSVGGSEQPAQLLLVLSDGHGVFREGMEMVRRAVRRARQSRIFLVFLILDSPDKKGSLLDARVPIMEASGKIKEIKSYMELFPFPFYIFLRDINTMPQILSDALRQWFELVTATDR